MSKRQEFNGYPPVTLTLDVSAEALTVCSLIKWHCDNEEAEPEELVELVQRHADALHVLAGDILDGLTAFLQADAEAEAPTEAAPPSLAVRSTDGGHPSSRPTRRKSAPPDTRQETFIDFFGDC